MSSDHTKYSSPNEKADNRALAFWGKYGEGNSGYHPLLYHCLDAGNVARLMLKNGIARNLLDSIEETSQQGREKAIGIIAFFIALHDTGKAVPAFQLMIQEHHRILTSAGISIPKPEAYGGILHGEATYHIAKEALTDSIFKSKNTSARITAHALAAHHGSYIRPDTVSAIELGGDDWKSARDYIINELKQHFIPWSDPVGIGKLDIENPGDFIVLTGLISIADWLASNEDYFPYECTASADVYVDISKQRARDALEKTGWLPKLSPAQPKAFKELFTFTPNNMQQKILSILDDIDFPAMFIIEAQMGQGKTEAALTIADRALSHGANGFYVALPTMATSNAMHDRVKKDYLEKSYTEQATGLKLVHGNALLHTLTKNLKTHDPTDASDKRSSRSDSDDWFAPKKRALLTSFGVGTIDQSLLSVLQTRHWFVRLFGLAGKVVIFDEVHAYDTYMSTILERLLRWLKALNATVVILSATLPKNKRAALVKAYNGKDFNVEKIPRYPRISVSSAEKSTLHGIEAEKKSMSVGLHKQGENLDSLANTILARTSDGGCVAVICNTVGRAQEAFRILSKKNEDAELLLFHARTPFVWRQKREEQVLKLFGKPEETGGKTTSRPHKAILVATQVVEQSLDLDFDAIYSDIAPIDLLIQRIGRTHRHDRSDRAAAFPAPECTVLIPVGIMEQETVSNAGVYDKYVVLKTWLAIRDLKKVELPGDIDPLVQLVYGDIDPPRITNSEADILKAACSSFRTSQIEDKNKANIVLVSNPLHPEDIVYSHNMGLIEDENDPDIHHNIRAATRLGEPGIQVVCLNKDENGACETVDGVRVSLEEKPNPEQLPAILNSSMSISAKALYGKLKEMKPVNAWYKIRQIRHHRALLFSGGKCPLGDLSLNLDEIQGLTIRKP